MLNSQGKVIGVAVSTLRDSQNLNFAVSVGGLRRLLTQVGPVSPFPSVQRPPLAARPPEPQTPPTPKASPAPRLPVDPDPVFPSAKEGKDMGSMILIPAGESWMGLSSAQVERLVEACQREPQEARTKDGMWLGAKQLSEGECRDALSSERPGRTVNVRLFLIDKRLVSIADFKSFIDGKGFGRRELWSPAGWAWLSSPFRGDSAAYSEVDLLYKRLELQLELERRRARLSLPATGDAMAKVRADQPLRRASWFEAQAYCHSVGKRLPTEAEWEKAARGDGKLFAWGNEAPPMVSAVEAHTVGVPRPAQRPYFSPYGLGEWSSQWEWVEGWWSDPQSGLKIKRGVFQGERRTVFEQRLTRRESARPEKPHFAAPRTRLRNQSVSRSEQMVIPPGSCPVGSQASAECTPFGGDRGSDQPEGRRGVFEGAEAESDHLVPGRAG